MDLIFNIHIEISVSSVYDEHKNMVGFVEVSVTLSQ